MNIREAIEAAWFSLNSGGQPQVLCRWKHERIGAESKMIRVFEVRVRWTGPKKPLDSDRGPIITESRKRFPHGWEEWRLDATPFAFDDLAGWAQWTVRSPSKVNECPRCEELEVRTDPQMLIAYGPFLNATHKCAMHLFPEAELPEPP